MDTIICLRTSAPLLIAVIEFYYLGRELPSARSWASLLGVLAGVIIYVRQDINFGFVAYLWLGLWYFFAVFDMVFVKHICNTVEMSTWTRTYYQVCACEKMVLSVASSIPSPVKIVLCWCVVYHAPSIPPPPTCNHAHHRTSCPSLPCSSLPSSTVT